MIGIAPQEWKTDLPGLWKKRGIFMQERWIRGSYKGFSGRYGSYAQKGGAAEHAASAYDGRMCRRRSLHLSQRQSVHIR